METENINETQLKNRLKNDRKISTSHSPMPLMKQVLESSWTLMHYHSLPEWLQDNEYLHHWHRPQLPSFQQCVRSIFKIHTETVNIWSHLLGCFAFLAMTVYFLTHNEIHFHEKIVMSPYLIGAILCLGFSFAFHTFTCHSEPVGKFFGRLDYFGISLLITCSFIPSLYYAFYCHREMKIFYMGLVIVLGSVCAIVTLWERFSEPRFRPFRAAVFSALGLFGVIPTAHYMYKNDYWTAIYETSFACLMIMAFLYLCGAILYALRIPERFFPGKCDVFFHSHQFMHMFVVAGAFVHYQGITEMAKKYAHHTCDQI